jgi:hypothetical protein
MTDQSIEFLTDVGNKLSAEVARLEAECASRDKVLEEFKKSERTLAGWLGDSHAYLELLLGWMERAQGNIPPELRKLITKARENLTLQQNELFKNYGDWNNPGEN